MPCAVCYPLTPLIPVAFRVWVSPNPGWKRPAHDRVIISTKKGEPMEFVTLEDQTGLYDATLFPNTYRRYCLLLAANQAYVVTGRVEEQFSTVTLTVRELRLLAARDIRAQFEPIEEVIG